MIGAAVAHGRGFDNDASQPGRDNVVILSDGFWRRLSTAIPPSSDVLSSSRHAMHDHWRAAAHLQDLPVLNRELDLYRPLVMDPTDRNEALNVWAKLKPGVSVDTADAQIQTVYATLPSLERGWSATALLLSKRLAAGPSPC